MNMNIVKWGLTFLGVNLVISIFTVSLTVFWRSQSQPTMEVFRQSPFVFVVEGNTSYCLFLGTLNGDYPSFHFDDVDVAVTWISANGNPKLALERDSGNTQIECYEHKYGHVKAISVATLKPSAPGKVQVSVSGWSGPNCVFVVDHGFGWFFVVTFGVAVLNLVLSAAVVRLIFRKKGT